jgi:hypothetical protein
MSVAGMDFVDVFHNVNVASTFFFFAARSSSNARLDFQGFADETDIQFSPPFGLPHCGIDF